MIAALLSALLRGARRRAPAQAAMFEAESFTLENGLQVVVLPNHRAPIVTQMVWYKVGADEEITRQDRHRAFPRASHVPRHQGDAARRVLAHRRREWRARQRLHHARLHRLFPERRGRPAAAGDEARGRAHERTSSSPTLWWCPSARSSSRSATSRIDNNPSALLNEQLDAALYLNQRYRTIR